MRRWLRDAPLRPAGVSLIQVHDLSEIYAFAIEGQSPGFSGYLRSQKAHQP